MTRINCIPPEELTQKHLLAEYRELPRLFALVRAAAARGERPNDPRNPKRYILGAGHVRFFYPRLKWVYARQVALVEEMKRRGYAPSYEASPMLFEGIPPEWLGDWEPDLEAQTLNRARIAARLNEAAARKAAK